jgi:hypothetical protein
VASCDQNIYILNQCGDVMSSYKHKIGTIIVMPLATMAILFSQLAGAAEAASGFDQVFELQGISFHVICPNQSSINQLEIIPAGLAIDNAVIKREIDGTVTGAEVADLNGDGSPELYTYISSAGSGSYGTLVAYAANNKKFLSVITLPPLMDDKESSRGYMGHDEFAVVENTLVRRFPVYVKGDTNASPTGGTRQLQYKLKQGETSWGLEKIE